MGLLKCSVSIQPVFGFDTMKQNRIFFYGLSVLNDFKYGIIVKE